MLMRPISCIGRRGGTLPAKATVSNLTVLAETILLVALCSACGNAPKSTPPHPPSVTVTQPGQEVVAEYVDLTGTVAPSRTVDLVARVTGFLQSVNFQEGAYVEAGQLLFVIEPEPYDQQLLLTKAALLRAQSEYDRQLELSKQKATSMANVEKWRSDRDQVAAQVELATINLSYTRVTAPFSGRIGRRFVDPGNLVGPNVNTKLATLDQLLPIYVNFNLNERDALNIREFMKQRGMPSKFEPGKIPVLVGLQNQEGYPQQGTLDFVDTGLNPSSGTILMRAVFKNEDRTLLPGFFARVRIPLGEPQPMLVLPNSAFGNDQEGDYVLALETSDLVVRRAVIKGPITRTGCAIRSGLTPTDRIIIDGQIRARPGAKVTPVNAGVQTMSTTSSP
jgi:membrane fusion protein, multidrug efflux system